MRTIRRALPGVAVLALTAASAPAAPLAASPTAGALDARADALLARMTLARKVAQLIQPDIASITPDDVRRYRFGSVLNGGNSGPGGNDKAPASAYLALADAFWEASTAPLADGEPAIPLLWATDAVHGDNNIVGATLFPHNIGLGAADDPDLTRRIGAVTAREIAVTGLDWAFAPTVAVVRDTRWGRSYESYSEDPARVEGLAPQLVDGLQGTPGTPGFLDERHVLATIKHFFGDGGTGGRDQGDTRGALGELVALHAAPYRSGIAAGAQTVMASFSSINGEKMHGNHALLTGLLRDDMHFDGLVVGDWNGHGQVPGCTNADCPRALLAGLDVFMVPDDWRALFDATLREVRDGTIPLARIDEAVRRVLRVKLRYGLLDKPRPSARALAGQWALIGAPEHRAVAREAVRKSLVLLKNDGVLPLAGSARILVAGRAADAVAAQAGGWSLSWQGGGALINADYPGATSIFAGIAAAARAAGGTATLSPDGRFARKPDVAVVVFGEPPYAETAGDRPDHRLDDPEGLTLLRRFRAAHVPTVAVLLSGRPLWVNRELAAADAFVAAWLPGSEGEGVADVLVGDARRLPAHDFAGRLPFHWPATCTDAGAPLVPVGGGGGYAAAPHLPRLATTCAVAGKTSAATATIFRRDLGRGVLATVPGTAGQPDSDLPGLLGSAAGGAIGAAAVDFRAQEDGRRLTWRRAGAISLQWPAALARPRGVLVVDYAVDGGGTVTLAGCAGCRPATTLRAAGADDGAGWQSLRLPLHCLGPAPVTALTLRADAPAVVRLGAVTIEPATREAACPAT